MMKKLIITAMALIMGLGVFAQDTWVVDPAHTNVRFSVTHLMISEVDGSFGSFEGTMTSSKDDFSDANIDFTIQANTIKTGVDKRDEHLKSADFFEVETYPTITFKGDGMTKVSDKKYKLKGELTMHGVTEPIELDVTYLGTVKDGYGNTKAGFKVEGELDRYAYGLKWNHATEAGGVTVSQMVDLSINVQLAKK
jgi:polyisoprenoid-binding protein YceI